MNPKGAATPRRSGMTSQGDLPDSFFSALNVDGFQVGSIPSLGQFQFMRPGRQPGAEGGRAEIFAIDEHFAGGGGRR